MFTIDGVTLCPGEKRQVVLYPAADYEMPATLVCGGRPGKTVLITAGLHAGEYPGIPAVIRLAEDLDANRISGNLILVHCVNTSGFWARTDRILPEDGGDLNACFPGAPDGTVSQRIADYFAAQILPHVDFAADLHAGSQQEALTPCLFFPQCESVREASLAAARALDIPLLIQSSSKGGLCGYAAWKLGIPALLLERGYSGFCREEWIDGYRNDLRMLLEHLDVCSCERKTAAEKRVFMQTVYLEAEEDGIWYCAVRPGCTVKKGQLLGRTEDFFGRVLHTYHAEADGFVFYHCCGLSVKAGRCLAAYGVEAS